MLRKRRVGLRGLALWYVFVAAALASIGAATSSPSLEFVALIVLILIGPTREAVTVERREPAAVVVVAIVAFAAVLAALTGLTYVLADALGASADGPLVL